MLRIQQLKIQIGHTKQELEQKLRRELHLKPQETLSYEIRKRSIDARKKPELFYSYVIDCQIPQEERVYKRTDHKKVILVQEREYSFPPVGREPLKHRPVIIGMGPAGLFCGLLLAKHGYQPILLERGMDVDTRMRDVKAFWEGGALNPQSNVQFGEGGAGTFSDGKLNTLVKDKDGRNREVLRLFAHAGADASILYENKPHIGTDVLVKVVKNIRMEIESLGGSVHFGTEVTGFQSEKGRLTGLVINNSEVLPCDAAVLAIGHSARNTFQMLYDSGICMESKEFAAGFRVEHRQKEINLSQYGRENPAPLQAASYKVTAKAENGRSVYSFCMCPGGYVVNASSEPGRLAVNGMSYSGRDGSNANSAIIVSVKKSDFGSEHPLAGIKFQRQLEEAAFGAGNGKIPVQRLGDLRNTFRGKDCSKQASLENAGMQTADAAKEKESMSDLQPCMKGGWQFADLSKILPREMTKAFLDGMEQFSHMIRGFDEDDVLVSAIESRTSSPVRILRDQTFQSNIEGIYPCGEGAGYAGGITSAAMDGMRIAEAIAEKYRPFGKA